QRMDTAGITYRTAGENLALAPSLDIAHEGLMNSPGHRANILNADFGRVGIGVLDGGVYGKMFVQEFRD
ncbi:MAG: CAP domain-containing protein, partial [Chloroflexia bacterium]